MDDRAPPDTLIAHRLAQRPEGGGGLLHVTTSTARLWGIVRALALFRPDLTVLGLPPWDCLPYDRRSPGARTAGCRAGTLAHLAAADRARVALVTTPGALLQRVAPPNAFRAAGFRARRGEPLDLAALEEWLEDAGYALLPIANEPGEAAFHHDRIDVFPPDAAVPLRLDLEDGRLAALRPYDALSQRGGDRTLDADLFLPPAAELLLTPEVQARFLDGWRDAFGEAAAAEDPLARAVAEGERPEGIEHWLPLAHPDLPSLLDLLPDAALSCDGGVAERAEDRLAEIADAYQTRREEDADPPYRPLPPDRLYLTADAWAGVAGRLEPLGDGEGEANPAQPDAATALAWVHGQRKKNRRLVVLTASRGEAARAHRLLRRADLAPAEAADWAAAAAHDVALLALDAGQGFTAGDLAVVTARELDPLAAPSGGQGRVRRLALDMTGLVAGDLVVHLEHGIGRCEGLVTLDHDGLAHDFVQVRYRDDEKVLVPVEHADAVWRYGTDTAEASLDTLGSARWAKRLEAARDDLRLLAKDLVREEKRRRETGAPVLAPPSSYGRFAARFPHVETPDQRRAIRDVLHDLAAGVPMDRLVCGDVGFGKTEVAIRAAFVAAAGGHQVAVVAPTTPLCRQHYEDFRARLRPFGLRVAQLGRTVARGEADAVKAALKAGDVDVVIGTQALFDAEFARLGLLVVDEEQRLGAKQKERLGEINPALHVLSMTATPIPRTLQAALAGLRDISLIATAPVERAAVRTVVQAFDGPVVRQAILRERRRGGQCFYVCPRIEDLEPARARLAELVPEAGVAVAHAKLGAAQLDEVMIAFAGGRPDVLLSTNIIEAGLNIPNANTLIVEHADLFGLAQLHQLRGRVGRSGRPAHAYLLHDGGDDITDGARERLETLRAFSDPGAGLMLAARDRDLRGGGVLFGEDQAGHARDVGSDLLQELLRREILRARGERRAAEQALPQISLGMAAHIPDAYIAEPDLRLDVYRRIALAEDPEALETELVDRFGPLPAEVDDVLLIAAVKRAARAAEVDEVAAGPRGVVFRPRTRRRLPKGFKRRDDGTVLAAGDWPEPRARAAAVLRLLGALAAD